MLLLHAIQLTVACAVHTCVPFHKCAFQDARTKLIDYKKALPKQRQTPSVSSYCCVFFFFSILLLSLSIARSATNINNEIQIVCDQAQFVIKPANPYYTYNHTVKSFYFDYYSSSYLLCKWLSSLSPYSFAHSFDRSFAFSLHKLFCT